MSEPAPTPPPLPSGKLATVVTVAALTIGLSGYFMGLLQTGRSAERIRDTNTHRVAAPDVNPLAPNAPRYRELATRVVQPNHQWTSRIADLAPPPPLQDGPRPWTADKTAHWVGRRTDRRAFDGAPPTVPHPVDQSHAASCLSCHGQRTRIGSIDVPQISHPPYTSCLQCHAPSGGPTSTWASMPPALATPVVDNAFIGKPSPVAGTRAYSGAPPTVPHPAWMRQNCLSCHGNGGSSAIKTTHPTRQNCVQCHALDASLDLSPGTRSLREMPALQVPPPLAVSP